KKMCTLLIMILIFACVFQNAYCQDSAYVKTAYTNSTYRLQNKLFTTYMVSEKHQFKLSRPDSLGKLLFHNSPESKKMLQRGRVATAVGLSIAAVGALSGIYSTAVAIHYDGRVPLPGILLAGGTAMLIIAIPIECRAVNLTNKFLWAFNRDAISNLSERNKSSEETR
ncbi:MAG TPA: hypothetical protein VHO70_18770, partial [Chitinispirillaceae bacterium]|nr:hypothetical protein [Chitinispirillaceae bacterium]